MDKHALLRAAIAHLEAEAETLRAAAEATRAGATHEESRPENDKDTRGLEASYLARGQAKRVEETLEAITRLRFLDLREFDADGEIDLGALVSVLVDDQPRTYFLVPAGGGLEVEGAVLLNPASPVGRALLGKCAGDEFELKLAGRVRVHEVVAVR